MKIRQNNFAGSQKNRFLSANRKQKKILLVVKINALSLCHVNKTTGCFPGNKKSDTMKPEDIYNGLEYTTKEINRTFKIKVNGLFNGKKINTLVGVYGLIKLVGVEMANKLLRRAFRCVKDAEHCKLRRGLKISFYYY